MIRCQVDTHMTRFPRVEPWWSVTHTNTSLVSLTSPIIVILHNLLSIFSSPGHCEPSPPIDHYHSPPHEGQIDPQVECPALHNLLSIFSIHLWLHLPNGCCLLSINADAVHLQVNLPNGLPMLFSIVILVCPPPMQSFPWSGFWCWPGVHFSVLWLFFH